MLGQLWTKDAEENLLAHCPYRVEKWIQTTFGEPRGAKQYDVKGSAHGRRLLVEAPVGARVGAGVRLRELVPHVLLVIDRKLRYESFVATGLDARIVEVVERHVMARDVADHECPLHRDLPRPF